MTHIEIVTQYREDHDLIIALRRQFPGDFTWRKMFADSSTLYWMIGQYYDKPLIEELSARMLWFVAGWDSRKAV